MDLAKRAKAYAKASILFFNSGNIRLAAKYWNKIYSMNLPFEILINTMRLSFAIGFVRQEALGAAVPEYKDKAAVQNARL